MLVISFLNANMDTFSYCSVMYKFGSSFLFVTRILFGSHVNCPLILFNVRVPCICLTSACVDRADVKDMTLYRCFYNKLVTLKYFDRQKHDVMLWILRVRLSAC